MRFREENLVIYLIQLQPARCQLTKHLTYGEDDDQKLSSDIFGTEA